MTTSYSEIFHGGSSGRSSVLECGSDTLLSPDLSPVSPDRQEQPLADELAQLATEPGPAAAGYSAPSRPSAALLDELERDARRLAASADGLIESLTGTMYSISSLAVDAMDAYRDAVCKTCDGVDANIKAMYQVMAKTEELNKTVKQVHPLAGQVREVRRLLDLFESAVTAGS
ncbi:uncharacterized protein LOC119108481 [Pollicipes pollicipes]|uniref:uncharacterized protein LOC119108481 n=1 Tax=Pollicipes pollicipes TaxID=41117 RepID=UPI001884DE22|nr:uncharacterized protein LOC119108481 [Pollicipes pollicipes]XP_037087943.1 uncharacterized protein LOC119108481 [Pollicipes pollicipes]XP_037087944.1 uncharacterized protein LOC119108481 [Pollicipes pollicipes]XP_037087945.1 uncharacterized protein LOC119108481 [Pollicipes pollicipes]XP_037087946.1 uncharacterized protein LOC119108481 [Pollicipes pollicipes]XP_037087947.1 uncharacterized protein LOC119108481 [Pollicipes pollicipes]